MFCNVWFETGTTKGAEITHFDFHGETLHHRKHHHALRVRQGVLDLPLQVALGFSAGVDAFD